jgi:hypothetical protein
MGCMCTGNGGGELSEANLVRYLAYGGWSTCLQGCWFTWKVCSAQGKQRSQLSKKNLSGTPFVGGKKIDLIPHQLYIAHEVTRGFTPVCCYRSGWIRRKKKQRPDSTSLLVTGRISGTILVPRSLILMVCGGRSCENSTYGLIFSMKGVIVGL